MVGQERAFPLISHNAMSIALIAQIPAPRLVLMQVPIYIYSQKRRHQTGPVQLTTLFNTKCHRMTTPRFNHSLCDPRTNISFTNTYNPLACMRTTMLSCEEDVASCSQIGSNQYVTLNISNFHIFDQSDKI